MAKFGKKYQDAAKLIESGKLYASQEAMELVKKTATAKFDETIELHVRLGVDPKYADQQVRGALVLPNGTGKTQRVLVFAKGEKVAEAEAAGADFVGSDEIVQKIQGGWLDFDVAVATPDMMGTVGRLGKVLGPRGLMPNPKLGTVTMDLKKAAGIEKASGEPNKVKVAKLPRAKAREIAESKMPDLNAASIEAATSMIEGTARSMGIEITD